MTRGESAGGNERGLGRGSGEAELRSRDKGSEWKVNWSEDGGGRRLSSRRARGD